MKRLREVGLATLVLTGLAAAWSCASWRTEGLEVATLPAEVQPDYALFAQRCSKCHSLARPLTSGIDEDAYWVDYVARMRRQPASGISEEDTVGILRFLHYFSIEEKRKSGKLPPIAVVSIPVVVSPSAPLVVPAPIAAPPSSSGAVPAVPPPPPPSGSKP